MKHKNRILSLFLVLCMLCNAGSRLRLSGRWDARGNVCCYGRKIENPGVELRQDSEVETLEQEPYDETEVVRAIVVLKTGACWSKASLGRRLRQKKGYSGDKASGIYGAPAGIGTAKNQKADRRQSGNPQVPLSCGGERHGSGASLWDFGRSSGSAGVEKVLIAPRYDVPEDMTNVSVVANPALYETKTITECCADLGDIWVYRKRNADCNH